MYIQCIEKFCFRKKKRTSIEFVSRRSAKKLCVCRTKRKKKAHERNDVKKPIRHRDHCVRLQSQTHITVHEFFFSQVSRFLPCQQNK